MPSAPRGRDKSGSQSERGGVMAETGQGHHGKFDGKAFFAKAGPGRRILKHGADEIIFSQGDAGDAVFLMLEGKAKISVVSEEGKEAVIGLLTTEDFFGEGCLAGQPKRLSTITTITKCT